MAITKRFIISFGGSLISRPDGIAIDFLKSFTQLIRNVVQEHPDWQLFLVTGGGSVCRQYQNAVSDILPGATNLDRDWIGTYSTQFNGQFVRILLQDVAHETLIADFSEIIPVTKPVAIAAGWRPGHSTDVDAVLLAEQYKADTIINLSNIDYVYDKDPRAFPDAKPKEHMTWDELKSVVGGADTWTAGKNTPFDPVATQKASEMGITVIIANGENLENFKAMLEGNPYKGTTITP